MTAPNVSEELVRPAAMVRAGALASTTFIIGSLAYKVVAFLAVPILARLLTPAELGLLDLSVLVAGAVSIAAVGGMDHAIARLDPMGNLGRLWATAIVVFILIGFALLLLIALALGPLTRLVLGEAADPLLLAVGAGYGVALAAVTMTMNAVRLYAAPAEYAIVGFVILTAEITAAIGIAASGGSPQWILGSWAVISLLAAVAIGLRRVPRLAGVDLAVAKSLLAFGLPLVPAAIVWHLSEVGVRAAIANSGDLSGLGAYGIVHRVTSLLPIIAAGSALAWQPLVYRAAKENQVEVAAQGVLLVVAALSVVGMAISALSSELISLVGGDAYSSGRAVVPMLSLAAMLSGGFTMLTISAGLGFRTRSIAVLATIGAVVQVVGAVLLVPGLGLPGAALASVAGYASASIGAFALFGWTSAARAVPAVWVMLLAALGVAALIGIGPEASVFDRAAVALAFCIAIVMLIRRDSTSAISSWLNREP